MSVVLRIVSIALYCLVGIVSYFMFYRSAFAGKLLPFQEAGSGKRWEEIEPGLQAVLLALLRLSGLGFLLVGTLLIVFPVEALIRGNAFEALAAPIVALFYCAALALVNYALARSTKSPTPWKRSLYAAGAILAGIVLEIGAGLVD
ncbi:MAG TPA: hypothetical protein VMG34_03780 [Bacteroidota bacterium]|nr:hypothetical protein [Bacteroidota bacterium]